MHPLRGLAAGQRHSVGNFTGKRKAVRDERQELSVPRAGKLFSRTLGSEIRLPRPRPSVQGLFPLSDRRRGTDAVGELPLVRYNPEIVFVEPKEKQRGIRKVQELYHIPDEDIVVFGDGMNDLCMFGQGWLSIAMGNARDALQGKS